MNFYQTKYISLIYYILSRYIHRMTSYYFTFLFLAKEAESYPDKTSYLFTAKLAKAFSLR